MLRKFDFASQLSVLILMSLLALSLPLATQLVKQSQDDRSRATDASTSKVSFKIAFKGVKPSYTNSQGNNYNCLSSLDNVKVEVVNVTTNTFESNINTSFTPVLGETNPDGDQVFLVSNLILDSKFNNVNNFNYLRIKGSRHLASRMCLDNQDNKLDELSTCEINLKNSNNTTYDFSDYSLIPGDINQDGVVNSADYSVIKNNFNNQEISCGISGDLNYDGIVNSLDANLLKDTLSEKEDGEIIIRPTTVPTNQPTNTPTNIITTTPGSNPTVAEKPTGTPTEEEPDPDPEPEPTTNIAPTPTVWDKQTYDPIKPSKSTYTAESETLKVYVVKHDGYYTTHIWAKEPYKQLRKYTTDKYGKEYDQIDNILEKTVDKVGIKDKIAVGFNNDIHVKYNAFYNNSKYWKKYSGNGIILNEGEVKVLGVELAFECVLGKSKKEPLVIHNDTPIESVSEKLAEEKKEDKKDLYDVAKDIFG